MNEDLLIMPGTPVLVPELSVGDEDAEQLRAVVLAEMSEVLDAADPGRRVVVVREERAGQDTMLEGSLRAWGADLSVGAGRYLPELVARWALGELGVRPDRIIATDTIPTDPGGPVIVVADGPAALTAAAPLTLLPEARALDDACLAIADGGAVREAAAVIRNADTDRCGLYGATMWLLLADLARDLAGAAVFRRVYSAAPYGVGYHVARWSW